MFFFTILIFLKIPPTCYFPSWNKAKLFSWISVDPSDSPQHNGISCRMAGQSKPMLLWFCSFNKISKFCKIIENTRSSFDYLQFPAIPTKFREIFGEKSQIWTKLSKNLQNSEKSHFFQKIYPPPSPAWQHFYCRNATGRLPTWAKIIKKCIFYAKLIKRQTQYFELLYF